MFAISLNTGCRVRIDDNSTASHVCGKRSGGRHDKLLQPVQERGAMVEAQGPTFRSREGEFAEQGRPCKTGRHV